MNFAKQLLQSALSRAGYTALRSTTLYRMRCELVESKDMLEALRARCQALEAECEASRMQSMASENRVHELEGRLGSFPDLPPEPQLDHEFAQVELAGAALQKLLKEYQFHSVLDIGAGALAHSKVFAQHRKAVTAVDFGTSIYNQHKVSTKAGEILEVIGDYNQICFAEKFDCVWASHVLEHQLNVHDFLRKAIDDLREGGVLAISVPPLKHEIVGGHASLWNAGLLLYRLVLAGMDCSSAKVLSYGYNISVIVEKRGSVDLQQIGLDFDAGDIRRIRPYLPPNLPFRPNRFDDPFDGHLINVDW